MLEMTDGKAQWTAETITPRVRVARLTSQYRIAFADHLNFATPAQSKDVERVASSLPK